jgi:hypothetical protein
MVKSYHLEIRNKQRHVFFENLLKAFDDIETSELGDLRKLFTKMTIDDLGSFYFSIGDYDFQMQSTIFLTEEKDEIANFKTFEIVKNVYRLKGLDNPKLYVENLELFMNEHFQVFYLDSAEKSFIDRLYRGKFFQEFSGRLIEYLYKIESNTL